MASEIANVDQAAAWDGPDGEYWAAHQERFDVSIRPHHARLMAAAAIAPGERVLDVGCGNGLTSRDAARAAGPDGAVLAVDLSGPMLARAEQTAKDEGLATIRFEQADAQVHPFEPGGFDVVMSRFGVMFFADPVAAFTNIAPAVRPGGRLAMLVWQPLAANEWMTAMREALAVGRDLPVPPPGTPGPFGLADTGFATLVLTGAGFTDVAFAGSEQPFNVGPDADTAYAFASGLQPVLMMLADLNEPAKARALDNLRATIAAHERPDGVVFRSAAWVITARKP
ncbi:MAG TPA: methyltransferase domain-containing protein [Acidimicrobiia bacterium]|nr:methyltransferase domain-containing protein [Acidimicrobiia bacterium]HKN90947.1 methyltransferase domain-containing protein [Acidimicrobiia bacterium]